MRAPFPSCPCRYTAVVESVTAEGGFVVVFEEYGTREEVGKDAIQLQQPPEEEGGYKGGCINAGNVGCVLDV